MQQGFLKSIQQNHPDLWASIVKNSQSGLILIDEQNDSITATNRLLFTYPGLHEAITTLLNSWEETELKQNSREYFKELVKDLEHDK
ncbi:MAG: hypothetical protein IE909_02700 [Campylobacterales bacterium]|nr:hypothetical protein [Campylobacterales bacterium]